MSRVGKKPVKLPPGVTVAVTGNEVKVKGPKGELTRRVHPDMRVVAGPGEVVVERPSKSRTHRALHGLTRSLVANMVEGVTQGYTRSLDIVGTGYRAAKTGKKVTISVGYTHPVEIEPPPGVELDVPNPNTIIIKGINNEVVGQLAANIRAVRKPEPYLGKGVRYTGEKVRRKAGKAGKK